MDRVHAHDRRIRGGHPHRELADGKGLENDAAPRKKRWLSILWPWIAAGALLGLMSGANFFLMGTTALQQGERGLGIGYMALATIFPPVTVAITWWMGKN